MATVLTSFAELAQVMGCKVKAKKVVELHTYTNIEDKCGRKAAILWAWMQEQEACKRYGPKGEILHGMAELQAATGYEEGAIFGAIISLVRNGFAKLTANGQKVRAA